MLLIPAIDLKDGQCVRLKQGDMAQTTVFSDNPVEMAAQWVEQGTQRLHLVDLNGAFDGKPVNRDIINQIATNHPSLSIQIGGGIRDQATVEAYLEAGVQYCIIGTKAVEDPDFVAQLSRNFAGHIIVGIDAKNGMVATDGWAEVSSVTAIDLAQQFEDAGVSAIIYTDIARDGMMSGVNVEATRDLARSINIPVIASGGVKDLDDIKALMPYGNDGVAGSILGRSIYEGTIVLEDAFALVEQAS